VDLGQEGERMMGVDWTERKTLRGPALGHPTALGLAGRGKLPGESRDTVGQTRQHSRSKSEKAKKRKRAPTKVAIKS